MSGGVGGSNRGDASFSGGNGISWSAPVGHDPMHERQPTHAASTTTTGRFGWLRPKGFSTNGKRASKGQNGMHKSHPVQAESVMPTMACPMVRPLTPTF